MKDLPVELDFNLEEIPGWAIAFLDELGLPRRIYPEIMTSKQKEAFNYWVTMVTGVEDGYMESKYENGKTLFRITQKGREHIKSDSHSSN